MMKKIFLILSLLTSFQLIFAQSSVGDWKGELQVMGTKLPLIFHVKNQENQYRSTMDSPMQGAKDIPIQNTIVRNDSIIFDASNIGIQYKAKITGEIIEGTFIQNGMHLPLKLKRLKANESALNRPQTPQPPFPYDNKEVIIKNTIEGNTLAGTLTTPKNFDKKQPIVVFITGSGAQNRDEELFGHQPFLVIADALAKKGIASLRMDDRGIGGSEKGKDDPTTEDFAGDIASAVTYLQQNGFENIGLIGHSEGGMIAPMVATQTPIVRFMVLMAAPGVPIKQLMLQQNQAMLADSGLSKEMQLQSSKFNERLYDFIIDYKGTNLAADLDHFKSDFYAMYNQLNEQQLEMQYTSLVKMLQSAWFQYFIQFNPEAYLSKVQCPILALNGRLDKQVAAKENLEGIRAILEKNHHQSFKIIAFDHLNHLFQTATTGSPIEYAQIEETIAPVVLDTLVEWIKSIK